MANSDGSNEFVNVNEAVGKEWEAETTPYERIREIISHTYTPISANKVAEQARTSPKTARKHLSTLAEEGFVTTSTGKHGGTTYRRSPESLVVEQAADILEHVSTDDLVTRVSEMRTRIRDLQEQYGVESPEEFAIERTNQTLSENVDSEDLDPETIQEWQTTRRNLAFANAALSIATAERFVDGDVRSSHENGLAP